MSDKDLTTSKNAPASREATRSESRYVTPPVDIVETEEGLTLDTGLCKAGHWTAALPLGSAWVLIRPEGTAYAESGRERRKKIGKYTPNG